MCNNTHKTEVDAIFEANIMGYLFDISVGSDQYGYDLFFAGRFDVIAGAIKLELERVEVFRHFRQVKVKINAISLRTSKI